MVKIDCEYHLNPPSVSASDITLLGLYSCIGRLVVGYFKCCLVLSLAGSGKYRRYY